MNLKDAILSTISEIENHEDSSKITAISSKQEEKPPFKIDETDKEQTSFSSNNDAEENSEIIEDRFLHDLRERILVLFEGFQSPNNAKIEAKVDLTLNFLEHLLAKIDTKLEKK